jgi:hypothetical protein
MRVQRELLELRELPVELKGDVLSSVFASAA